MKINQGQAVNIVNNLKGLVCNVIFIFDPEGVILASNKSVVEDKYIQYGKSVATNKKILVANEAQLNDKCIVIPVNLDNELVAIIGLSGNFENVSQYGEIIVKVTELLLRESFHYERKIESRENDRFLMNELFSDTVDYVSVSSKAKLLGYNLELFNFIAIVEVPTIDIKVTTYDGILENIESCLKSTDLVGIYKNNFIILLTDSDFLSSKNRLKLIKAYLEKKLFTSITIGLSNQISQIADLKMAYYQSLRLLQLPLMKNVDGIFCFEDYALELVFFDISPKFRNNYVNNIFCNMSQNDINEICDLLELYINNNGSINHTSKLLYVHKNTLQYKLNKIWERTGYNPRDLRQLFKLYIALTFYYLGD